jgi:hypothetical protein
VFGAVVDGGVSAATDGSGGDGSVGAAVGGSAGAMAELGRRGAAVVLAPLMGGGVPGARVVVLPAIDGMAGKAGGEPGEAGAVDGLRGAIGLLRLVGSFMGAPLVARDGSAARRDALADAGVLAMAVPAQTLQNTPTIAAPALAERRHDRYARIASNTSFTP